MFITVKLVVPLRTLDRRTVPDTFTPASRALFDKKVLAHVASLDPDGASERHAGVGGARW